MTAIPFLRQNFVVSVSCFRAVGGRPLRSLALLDGRSTRGRKEGRLENLMPSPARRRPRSVRPSVAPPSVVTAARDVFNEEGNRGRGGEYVIEIDALRD